jgi:hypothetical protein
MATKGKPVLQTRETQLPPAQPAQPADGQVQVIQGNIPVLTIQLLAQVNRNLVEVVKRLDELIGIAKNG